MGATNKQLKEFGLVLMGLLVLALVFTYAKADFISTKAAKEKYNIHISASESTCPLTTSENEALYIGCNGFF
jgi:hypothetical protein